MNTKAVFFDLFETLITEFSNGQRISNRNYDYNKLLGITNSEFKIEWRIRQDKRMSGYYANYIEVIKDIVACKNLQVDEETIELLYRERVNEKIIPFKNIDPDVLELLEYLRDNNIKIGLISNCTEEEVKYWLDSKLVEYFNDYIFSFEVKCCKPDIGIYSLACDRLKVKPEESIFVGDGGSSELDGASKAGLKVYHAHWFNTYIQSEFKKLSNPKELIKELR